MKTEIINRHTSGRCLNIVANKVESLRINGSVSTTVRVYDGGNIGVAGKLGKADVEELTNKAKQNLAQNITYPETHEQAKTISVDTQKTILAEEELIARISKLLERLEKENPQFLFGNKIKTDDMETTFSDSEGTKLHYSGNTFIVAFSIKYKGSANIMDEFYEAESDYFDEDKICSDIHLKCQAFLNELPQIEENEVVVIGDFEPLTYALEHLNAELYFNKSSIFEGKLGQKIFADKFNLAIDRSPERQLDLPFFDEEGTVLPNYKFNLINNGTLCGLLANKKVAEKYKVATSGSSHASYDGIPTASGMGLCVEKTADDLAQLVKGKAVYLCVSSGGDMTPSGDISMPILVPYLYEDGKLLGKLPELTVSTNLYDAFGKDFVGVCENGLFRYGKRKYFVYKAKLVNKKS